jgi:hypothetical protein
MSAVAPQACRAVVGRIAEDVTEPAADRKLAARIVREAGRGERSLRDVVDFVLAPPPEW